MSAFWSIFIAFSVCTWIFISSCRWYHPAIGSYHCDDKG